MDAIAKLIAVIVITSFATDRIIAGAQYVLDGGRLRKLQHPAAGKLRARARRKFLLFVISAAVAANVLIFSNIRIAAALTPDTVRPELDVILTWIVLIGGADGLRKILQGIKNTTSGPERKETPAVRLAIENDGNVRAMPKAV